MTPLGSLSSRSSGYFLTYTAPYSSCTSSRSRDARGDHTYRRACTTKPQRSLDGTTDLKGHHTRRWAHRTKDDSDVARSGCPRSCAAIFSPVALARRRHTCATAATIARDPYPLPWLRRKRRHSGAGRRTPERPSNGTWSSKLAGGMMVEIKVSLPRTRTMSPAALYGVRNRFGLSAISVGMGRAPASRAFDRYRLQVPLLCVRSPTPCAWASLSCLKRRQCESPQM
ncbi:hypothetical protein DFH06DRAFT_600963 [Mycena polygramma]|nr:hypothetical protein DFH06DRAFT_600963 [Mycena polygramma]